MTVVGFCEANGLNAKTYYYWLRKLRDEVCRQAVVAIPNQGNPEEKSGTIGVRLQAGDIVVEIGS